MTRKTLPRIEKMERRRLFAAGPDQVLYVAQADPAGIYIANDDGSNAALIPIAVDNADHPAFTPDRDKIVFSFRTSESKPNSEEIGIIGVDGSFETHLTSNGSADTLPRVSPDGQRIVFISNRDGNDEIYTMDTSGRNLTRLTFNAADDTYPSYSPDGTKILFTSNRSGKYQIYTIDAATGLTTTRLTNNTFDDKDPAYSPEGRRIAFSSNRSGALEIWMMTDLGASQRQLTSSAISGLTSFDAPTFSNDGFVLLVHFGNPDGGNILEIANDDGGSLPTHFGQGNKSPSWSSAPRFSGISQGVVTITGTAGADHISLSPDTDGNLNITLNGKTEQISDAFVNDIQIFCGDGNDVLDGSIAGHKFYASGDAGDDKMIGGELNDTLTGGSGRNTLFGGDGDDRLNGSGGRDFLYGEGGNDRMYGNAGNDYMVGGGNIDRMWGGDGDDFIAGVGANDKLYGENGNDQLFGQDGNDQLYGGSGIDTINGGKGTDTADNDDADVRAAIELLA